LLVSQLPEDLCLAFANTRTWRGSDAPVETLRSGADLLAWLDNAGIGAESSRERPRPVDRVFSAALELREAIFRVFAALAAGDPPGAPDYALLSNAVAEAPPRHELARAAGGFAWRIERRGLTAPALLAPVLWSAADLLVGAGRRRIRQCANEKCLWLFLDESKSGTRRWCDMSSCGNRAKARRHYARSKEG
jgi:predicted RNA-binding Zn ribbon-like protein